MKQNKHTSALLLPSWFWLLSGALAILFFNACRSTKSTPKSPSKQKEAFCKEYTLKFGFPVDPSCNEALYKSIGSWLGTPYKYSGCEKTGVDCSCFVFNIYKEAYNVTLKRNTSEMVKEIKQVDKEKCKEGDLLFFKTEGNKVSHVGIYLKDNKFAHASTKRGVMISDLTEAYFVKTFYVAGRIN